MRELIENEERVGEEQQVVAKITKARGRDGV